jgi:hypothetical protein
MPFVLETMCSYAFYTLGIWGLLSLYMNTHQSMGEFNGVHLSVPFIGKHVHLFNLEAYKIIYFEHALQFSPTTSSGLQL